MRILTIVGTRPNFVKAAPLLEEMGRHAGLESILVHTGQHYDQEMSKVFFQDLRIPAPHMNLDVGSGTGVRQTAEIMLRLEPILEKTQPGIVVVVGDVNSTLAAALTAGKMGLPLAHVEAGLRSFDRSMPEEANRVLTDALAGLLFASEPSAVENLRREGRPPEAIHLVGNVMIDALRRFLPEAKRSPPAAELAVALADSRIDLARPYGLVTLHRPATVDDFATLGSVGVALEEIATELPLIFPVHPRTQSKWEKACMQRPGRRASRRLLMVPPLSYLSFLQLESAAALVITDSGGVQEETTALEVPCLTVRENTERPITLSEGTNVLVGLDSRRLVEEARTVLRGGGKRGQVPKLWDGHASERIVRVLKGQIGCGFKARSTVHLAGALSEQTSRGPELRA